MAKYIVRYGAMRSLAVLAPRGNEQYGRGDRVIARTPRGLEAAEVLCAATDQMLDSMADAPTGQILRGMTAEDINEQVHIKSTERDEFEICLQHVRCLRLPMQLVDIEHLFGGERIVVYYLAEHRVDFRELVKKLASEFQTRIEMRQIGVRDEAKLLADYGDCGKAVCCGSHLAEMPPVSMKMAKIQKATLDPTKISGRCGRLKCCLRYEYETYRELQKVLPPIGMEVETKLGPGRIISQEILAQQLYVQLEDHRRQLIDVSELVSLSSGSSKSKPESKRPPRSRSPRKSRGGPSESNSGPAS